MDDTVQLFTSDTLKGGAKKPELVKVGRGGGLVGKVFFFFNYILLLLGFFILHNDLTKMIGFFG